MFGDNLFQKTGLSLEKLRNFVLVASAGGIAKVTDDANRQSLISRQIKELEIFFGIELTTRKGKTIQLTPRGIRLAELARLHLTALGDFLNACGQEETLISIGAGNSILEWLLLPRIKRIHVVNPSTRLLLQHLRTTELIKEVVDCTLDLAIARTSAILPGLRHKPLGTLRYSLFIPEALISKRRPSSHELIGEVPVASLATGQFYNNLQAASKKAKVPLRLNLLCTSFTQAAEALRTKAYGAILPTIALQSLMASNIRQVPLPWFSSEARSLSLVWNPRLAQVRDKLPPLIEVLSDELKLALSSNAV